MANDLAALRGAMLTDTSLTMAEGIAEKRWAAMGEQLGLMERSVGWWVGDWWNAVVAYRAQGDSLLTGAPIHRLSLLLSSLPAAAIGLGLLGLLATIRSVSSTRVPTGARTRRRN